MVVLGSREQLCIHEEVSLLHGRTQTNACRTLCRKFAKRRCKHYNHAADYVKKNPHLGDEPIDIEDLVNIGRKFGPCPYYVSRELHKAVDILFAPYNYLIDRGYRKYLALDWTSSILIFDEAHNLEGICADAASFDLPSWTLTSCISEAKKCIDISIKRREESNDKSGNPDNFAILRALLLKLEKRIAEVPIQSKDLGFTKPGPYIYELLAELNITRETASKLKGIIEEAAVLLEEDKQQKLHGTVCRLESISNMLDIIFREEGNAHAKFYRVHVQEVEASSIDGLKGKARTLSWWCFNPGMAMEDFCKVEVGSIILTSGTLSPMESFAQELKLNFPVRLENPHVISSNQIWAGVVPVGPSGHSFNSSYWNRDSQVYKQDLGNAIVNFARIVPDGLLVFFPSYYFLDQCIGCWKNQNDENSTTIWERICKHKKPVVEPRQSSLFPSSIEDYMSKLKDSSTSGAVFFAVCRGKVSEGLDFADHAGRAVVITGLPFAARNDPKVRLKREYLDQQILSPREGNQALMGEEWYNQQASRAVNQAVGRVIRHRHDYGAMIFCDERFAHSSRQSQVSLWIQPHIKCYSKFGDVVFTLTRFFRDGGNRVSSKVNLIEAGDIGETKSAKPLGKLFEEKISTSMVPQFQDCSAKSPSSLLKIKVGNESSHWREVLPANRSSLTPTNKPSSSTKYLCDMKVSDKNLALIGKKDSLHQNLEIIDLTGNSLFDEQPNKVMVACAAKKRKLFSKEHGPAQHSGNFSQHQNDAEPSGLPFTIPALKHGPSLLSDSRIMQSDHVGSAALCKDDGFKQKRDSEFLNRSNKTVMSVPDRLVDEETRGSAFLIHVKEKLSATEYKEFVGFMKALKSKAMMISQVLQSIAKIFSGPDRLHLLKGFKDYVPAKYHSLYEQYLETSTSNQSGDAP